MGPGETIPDNTQISKADPYKANAGIRLLIYAYYAEAVRIFKGLRARLTANFKSDQRWIDLAYDLFPLRYSASTLNRFFQTVQIVLQNTGFPLNLHLDSAVGKVLDPTGNFKIACDLSRGESETDPLDFAAKPESQILRSHRDKLLRGVALGENRLANKNPIVTNCTDGVEQRKGKILDQLRQIIVLTNGTNLINGILIYLCSKVQSLARFYLQS